MEENDVNVIDLLNVIWSKKWIIIIPVLFISIVVGFITLLLPNVWEVDMIFLPGKILFQTDGGQFEEISIYDPKQLAEQISQGSYNNLLAEKFYLKNVQFNKLHAKNLNDTNLILVTVQGRDKNKAVLVLNSLFDTVRENLDEKISAELETIDIQIDDKKNNIEKMNINIKSKEIEKSRNEKEIKADRNLLKISEERYQDILEEMKIVKTRIEEIEKLQINALKEDKKGRDALSLLLYSNEIQLNLRYYNTLESSLSDQKISQENLKLSTMKKYEQMKLIDTEIETLRTEIELIKNQIELLLRHKSRIDLTQMIKEPEPSLKPVAPKRKFLVLITMILSLSIFTGLAFFIEYIEKQKQ